MQKVDSTQPRTQPFQNQSIQNPFFLTISTFLEKEEEYIATLSYTFRYDFYDLFKPLAIKVMPNKYTLLIYQKMSSKCIISTTFCIKTLSGKDLIILYIFYLNRYFIICLIYYKSGKGNTFQKYSKYRQMTLFCLGQQTGFLCIGGFLCLNTSSSDYKQTRTCMYTIIQIKKKKKKIVSLNPFVNIEKKFKSKETDILSLMLC